MALAGYASVTERVELGTGIVLLPLANPVRLAGEFALLDEMSNGRSILGVGLGYQEREFEALDVPMDERVTRFVDYIRIVKQLWGEGDVDFNGKSYELSDFEISPNPIQAGGPPIWCGGGADAALRRAARFGDEWMPSWPESTALILDRKERYHGYVDEYGEDPTDRINPVIRVVFVAETREVAVERARKSIQPVVDRYLEQGLDLGISEGELNDVTDLIGRGIMAGNPDDVVSQLSEFINKYETDHLIMKIHGPGMSHEETLHSIDLLGDEVLPRL